jgi:hypothetical protein
MYLAFLSLSYIDRGPCAIQSKVKVKSQTGEHGCLVCKWLCPHASLPDPWQVTSPAYASKTSSVSGC